MSSVCCSPLEVTDIGLADLRAPLVRRAQSQYAIVDACDEPCAPAKTQDVGSEQAVSLYRGWAERDYGAIAPYLVRVNESLLDWIAENLWNDPWGLFAVAAASLTDLHRHFQWFLFVRDAAGDRTCFRFYDRRALGAFVTNCTPKEAEKSFGPFELFGTSASGGWLATFRRISATPTATSWNLLHGL